MTSWLPCNFPGKSSSNTNHNDRWLLCFQICWALCGRKSFDAFSEWKQISPGQCLRQNDKHNSSLLLSLRIAWYKTQILATQAMISRFLRRGYASSSHTRSHCTPAFPSLLWAAISTHVRFIVINNLGFETFSSLAHCIVLHLKNAATYTEREWAF